jgi:uncharacterized protein YlzI (FlbEa/FlbD family)
MPARINLTNGDHILVDGDIDETARRIADALGENRFVSVTDTAGHEHVINPAAVAEINGNPRPFS